MGASLSSQEKQFIENNWTELIVDAADFDASMQDENDRSSRQSRGRRKQGFTMSVNEWQAIMALADESTPTAIPSLLLSSEGKGRNWDLSSAVRCPMAAALCHVVALCEGTITVSTALERLMELRIAVSETASATTEQGEGGSEEVQQVQDDIVSNIFGLAQMVTSGKKVDATLPSPIAVVVASPSSNPTNPPVETTLTYLKKLQHSVVQLNNTAAARIAKRPVLLLSIRTLTAWLLATGSHDACAQLLLNGHNEELSAGVHASLHRAMGLLQVLDDELKALGFTPEKKRKSTNSGLVVPPLPEYSLEHAIEEDAGRSVASSFGVIRRLQYQLQAQLLVLDALRMGSVPSLPHLLTSNNTNTSEAAKAPLTWKTLPQSYVGNHAVIEEVRKHFSSRARGIVADNKPSVLLFFGPSGHGKTELAKCISRILHPTVPDVEAGGKLVMIHLPSFCTKDSIYSLVDPPAAHVGEGMLLSALRKEEDAIVVLDEFEKSTADSIQHLWLSAFQKEGMLRSLKDASRSVSTCKATFILTCNLCDQDIHNSEPEYLAATPARQASMRQEFTVKCKEAVRAQFGEPFLNRIDFVLPFVPYTVQDKRDYVGIQLSKIAVKQARQYGRFFIPTPSYVTSLAATTNNFHGSDVTKRVCDVLFTLPEDEGSAATSDKGKNTLLAHMCPYACGSRTSNTSLTSTVSGCSYSSALGFATNEVDVVSWIVDGLLTDVTDDERRASTEMVTSIVSKGLTYQRDLLLGITPPTIATPVILPSSTSVSGGPSTPRTSAPMSVADEVVVAPATPTPTPRQPPTVNEDEQPVPATSSSVPPPQKRDAGELEMELELETEVDTHKETEKDTTTPIMLLEMDTLRQQLLDLSAEKETILCTLLKTEKEKTTLVETVKNLELKVHTLTERVKQLETVVGMLVMLCMCLGAVLALFIGLKAVFLLALLAAATLSLVVGNVLNLLNTALRSLYNFLGPAKFFGLLSGLIGFLAWGMALPPTPCSTGGV